MSTDSVTDAEICAMADLWHLQVCVFGVMSLTEKIVLIIEIVGTIAFASSGAMIGIRKNMDVFGVNVLGITTAIGGGIIRDLVLGIHPPKTFQNPLYVLISIGISMVLFFFVYFNKHILESRFMTIYEKVMSISDAIGLGAFTVIGINTAFRVNENHGWFLLIFVGMITGIGGGMLRDVMAGLMPYVFVKHIYAVASLIGAVVCIALARLEHVNDAAAMVIGAVVVIVIRMLASYYKWNLPRIQGVDGKFENGKEL